jgi:hypothetical protein
LVGERRGTSGCLSMKNIDEDTQANVEAVLEEICRDLAGDAESRRYINKRLIEAAIQKLDLRHAARNAAAVAMARQKLRQYQAAKGSP